MMSDSFLSEGHRCIQMDKNQHIRKAVVGNCSFAIKTTTSKFSPLE